MGTSVVQVFEGIWGKLSSAKGIIFICHVRNKGFCVLLFLFFLYFLSGAY